MHDRAPENRIDTYPHWPLDRFDPAILPDGRIDRLYTHWSAHDYASVFPAYHFCVAMPSDGTIVVVQTHDVRENMRDVAADADAPYAAHTRGRNAFAIGISVMAMERATPRHFGSYPVTDALISGLCRVGGLLCRRYGIALDADHVMSHAEAALRDGYFGTGENERWDIARLRAEDRPLEERDALEVGETLRAKMREAMH